MVLPSHRAGVHLRKYLAQASGAPIWSPALFEPSGFLAQIAGWRLLDSVEALLQLHRCHAEQMGNQADSLDEFLSWGPTTLRDFSEIDSHLLDLDALYRDLRAYHEIEAWSFRIADDLSRAQLEEVERWRHMGGLHRLFGAWCDQARAGTQGAIARKAASETRPSNWSAPWSTVWFVGLNALDPALSAVASALSAKGMAQFAWDADRHYLDDQRHEAGRFLRRSIQQLGPGLVPAQDAIASSEHLVESIAVPDRAAMVRHAASWVLDLAPVERDEAAIVLADESLAMPLLEAMPAEAGHVNVTMGLPLSALPAFSLDQAFVRLLENAAAAGAFDGSALRDLLAHPMLHEGEATRKLISRLPGASITSEMLNDAARDSGSDRLEELSAAFVDLPPSGTWPQRLQVLHSWAMRKAGQDPLARAQLHELARATQQLSRHLTGFPVIDGASKGYGVIRDRICRQLRLPLGGEPLQGLQVMGMLETRALDHRHVLVLGAEEGVLIGGEAPQSWIPQPIRKRWGLPMAGDADAITSYHVHRLLHGARSITLVHVTNEQSNGPSRFVPQWRHAFRGNQRASLKERVKRAPVALHTVRRVEVAKTPLVMEKLRAITAKGFSPTLLGRWLNCPLDFHARYILGLEDEPEPDGILANNTLGSAIHGVLESLLRPMIGKQLLPGELSAAARSVQGQLVDRIAAEGHARATLETGHNRLLIEMASHAVARYLNAEVDRCTMQPTTVEHIELPVRCDLGGGLSLKGVIDRIDRRDGILHVLDIKTGKVDTNHLSIKAEASRILESGQHQALQLICYAILAFKNFPKEQALKAGLIPLRWSSHKDAAWLKIGNDVVIHRSALPELEALVQPIAQGILDPAVPFMHDSRAKYCLACLD